MLQEQRQCSRVIGVVCFFKELPLPVASVVVPKEFATLKGYISSSIHANYRDMVKFNSENHNGFK